MLLSALPGLLCRRTGQCQPGTLVQACTKLYRSLHKADVMSRQLRGKQRQCFRACRGTVSAGAGNCDGAVGCAQDYQDYGLVSI